VEFDVKERTIFRCLSGSHAYGTATPESDEDFRGVAIPPKEWFLGFFRKFEQAESKPNPDKPEVPDEVIYDIRKFAALAADNNPNVLELLFMPDDCVKLWTPAWERLVAVRDAFLSTRVKHSYSGYALAQLKRIRQHRGWLLHPMKEQPTREKFGIPNNQALAEFKAKTESAARAGLDIMQLFGPQLQAEAAYKKALSEWNSYLNWKKTRNPVRAEMEARYGYDGKHASHLVRLLRQGYEILTTGKVNVRRPDADELLAIRRDGIWPYDQLVEYAENMDRQMTDIYDAGVSPLPKTPDVVQIDRVVVEIVEDFLRFSSRKEV